MLSFTDLSVSLSLSLSLYVLRYDTMEEFNVDSKAEYDQFNLTRSQKQSYKKEETKTKKCECPLSSVQDQDP